MTPDLPVDQKLITTQVARHRQEDRSTTLSEMESSLRRVGHLLLVASVRLHHLPLEEQLSYSASIQEVLKDMEEYWTSAREHLKLLMILPREL